LGTEPLAISTVAKKTLYDYKSLLGLVIEPFVGSEDLDEVSLFDIQKLALGPLARSASKANAFISTA
jgi:hypothetical protein